MSDKKRKKDRTKIPILVRDRPASTPATPLDPWAGVHASSSTLSHPPASSFSESDQPNSRPARRPAGELDDAAIPPLQKKAKVNNTIVRPVMIIYQCRDSILNISSRHLRGWRSF